MNARTSALARPIAPVSRDALVQRLASIDATRLASDLDAHGNARIEAVLTPGQCEELAALYDSVTPARESTETLAIFRSRVVMQRHGFGRGEYKYFAYPLPDVVAALRSALYAKLAPLANRWQRALTASAAMADGLFGSSQDAYPADLPAWLARCHAAGQLRPTPLLLHYDAGDYNCLHQDLYGELVFPLQATILLSRPDEDFTGGEFVLTEQRPRMQSRPEIVPLQQGDAVIFAVQHRPAQGSRGTYRVNMRHGVSRVRSGQRRTLGIIFHDAS